MTNTFNVIYPAGTIDSERHVNPWLAECGACGETLKITLVHGVPPDELIGAEHPNCPGRDPAMSTRS